MEQRYTKNGKPQSSRNELKQKETHKLKDSELRNKEKVEH